MARKKFDVDADAIAQAIAKDLPGFRLAKQAPVAHDAVAGTLEAECEEHGPSLKQLRRKFLGDAADAQESAAPDDYGAFESNRVSVRVEPKKGGPEKTVDIKGGKAKIVQG
jgi:hypothetical protein